jgi:hypothetical protein
MESALIGSSILLLPCWNDRMEATSVGSSDMYCLASDTMGSQNQHRNLM